jgi:hypothetical protein
MLHVEIGMIKANGEPMATPVIVKYPLTLIQEELI